MDAQGSRVEKLENNFSLMAKKMKMIEVHFGQIASTSSSQQKGKLPINTDVNPKSHVNSIHLSSGTSYDAPQMAMEDVMKEDKVITSSTVEDKEYQIEEPPKTMKKENDSMKAKEQPTIPFLQMLKQTRVDEKFSNFLEIFKCTSTSHW